MKWVDDERVPVQEANSATRPEAEIVPPIRPDRAPDLEVVSDDTVVFAVGDEDCSLLHQAIRNVLLGEETVVSGSADHVGGQVGLGIHLDDGVGVPDRELEVSVR